MKLNKLNLYEGSFKKKIISGIAVVTLAGTIVFSFNNCASLNGVIDDKDPITMEEVAHLFIIELEHDNSREYMLTQYTKNVFGASLYDVKTRKKIIDVTGKELLSEALKDKGNLITFNGMSKYFDYYLTIKDEYSYDEVMKVFDTAIEHYEDTREENVSKNIWERNRQKGYEKK